MDCFYGTICISFIIQMLSQTSGMGYRRTRTPPMRGRRYPNRGRYLRQRPQEKEPITDSVNNQNTNKETTPTPGQNPNPYNGAPGFVPGFNYPGFPMFPGYPGSQFGSALNSPAAMSRMPPIIVVPGPGQKEHSISCSPKNEFGYEIVLSCVVSAITPVEPITHSMVQVTTATTTTTIKTEATTTTKPTTTKSIKRQRQIIMNTSEESYSDENTEESDESEVNFHSTEKPTTKNAETTINTTLPTNASIVQYNSLRKNVRKIIDHAIDELKQSGKSNGPNDTLIMIQVNENEKYIVDFSNKNKTSVNKRRRSRMRRQRNNMINPRNNMRNSNKNMQNPRNGMRRRRTFRRDFQNDYQNQY